MLGNTSRLERALFNKAKRKNEIDIEHNYKNLAPIPYMEMWVPNHLARLNNVRGVHVPGKSCIRFHLIEQFLLKNYLI
jgi:hypothetical protein